jgi:hypothetical protein
MDQEKVVKQQRQNPLPPFLSHKKIMIQKQHEWTEPNYGRFTSVLSSVYNRLQCFGKGFRCWISASLRAKVGIIEFPILNWYIAGQRSQAAQEGKIWEENKNTGRKAGKASAEQFLLLLNNGKCTKIFPISLLIKRQSQKETEKALD